MSNQIVDQNLQQCLNNVKIPDDGIFNLSECKEYGPIETLEGIDSIETINAVNIEGYPRVDVTMTGDVRTYSGETDFLTYGIVFTLLMIIIVFGLRALSKFKKVHEPFM